MAISSGAATHESPQKTEVIMKSLVLMLTLIAALAGTASASTPCTPTASQSAPDQTEIELLQMRADEGDSDAQYQLANMYRNGKGVERDDVVAAGLYLQAAESGNVQAQYNLGVITALGKGLPKDNVRAYMWLLLAAAEGHSIAPDKRDLVGKLLTPAQLSEAQKLAQDWRTRKHTITPSLTP
jgi:TPR repeat protein